MVEINLDHKKIIERALRKRSLLPKSMELPNPIKKTTGISGSSNVYFFKIIDGQFVVKMDSEKRFVDEKENLPNVEILNLPDNILRPIDQYSDAGAPLIYRNPIQNMVQGSIETFLQVLESQFKHNTYNCIRALHKSLDLLESIHNNTPNPTTFYYWRDVYKSELKDFQEDKPDSSDRTWREIKGFFNANSPSPISLLDKFLDENFEEAKCSPVHGDFNLTNILFGVKQDRTLHKVYLIDLANFKNPSVTASDFSKLEWDFWMRIFPKLESDLARQMQYMNLIFNHLNPFHNKASFENRKIERIVTFIANLRHRANEYLGGNNSNGYILKDYYYSLYFYSILSLRFDAIKNDSDKIRLSLMVAALCADILQNIQRGIPSTIAPFESLSLSNENQENSPIVLPGPKKPIAILTAAGSTVLVILLITLFYAKRSEINFLGIGDSGNKKNQTHISNTFESNGNNILYNIKSHSITLKFSISDHLDNYSWLCFQVSEFIYPLIHVNKDLFKSGNEVMIKLPLNQNQGNVILLSTQGYHETFSENIGSPLQNIIYNKNSVLEKLTINMEVEK